MENSPRQPRGRQCTRRGPGAQNLPTGPECSEDGEICPHKRRGGNCKVLSRNNPGSGESTARVLGVSDLLPPRPAAPFKDSCKRGGALLPPAPPTGEPTKAIGWRWRMGGGAAWGVTPRGAGRRAPGERECQKREKKKKSRSFSPDFPAAAPRFGARAGFPAREAARTFGGAWNPLPVPGESRARGFPRLCWGLARRGGPACSRIPPRRWWRCFSPSLRPSDTW